MNSLVTSILTSTLMSAGVSALVTWFIQNNNYRNDYYKKILDKRIIAYERVEHLISKLVPVVRVGPLPEDKCPHFCNQGQDKFWQFMDLLNEPIVNSFWLSEEISRKLIEVGVFLVDEIENKIDDTKESDSQYTDLGKLHVDKITRLRLELQSYVYHDLSELHDVRKFTSRHRRGKKKLQAKEKSN